MRALVLEGGGGKGAYQMGALLALREANHRYDLVTGSSVGALNGLLLVTDQLDLGLRYWWNMSWGGVLRFRTLSLISLALQPFYWIGRLFGRHILGTHADPFDGLVRVVAVAVIWTVVAFPMIAISNFFGASIPLMLIFYPVVLAVLLSIPYLVVVLGFTAFRPRPLQTLIWEATAKFALQSRLIITLTEDRQSFDPDDPAITTSPGLAYGLTRDTAVSGTKSFPWYVDAESLSTEDLRAICLATSALPHGIFPAIRWRGKIFIDGGVSDNLPVYPALNCADVSNLTVIRLRPHKPADIFDAWQTSDRLLRLRDLTIEQSKALRSVPGSAETVRRFWPPVFLPFREPPHVVTQPLVIAPKTDLGGFVFGTLNFSRAKSRQLLQLGWQDCRHALGCPESLELLLPVTRLLARSN